MSLPAVTARLYSSDEVQYFSYLRSLYFDRDVSFENEYRYFYDRNIAQSGGFHETFLERETAAGRRVNYGTVGAAILWSPFYAAADAWTRAGDRYEANGFTTPYVRAVAYGSAFYGFLAILLSIRAARLARPATAGPLPPVWRSGSAHRCSSTCTSRHRSRMRARPSQWRSSSTSGCTCGDHGPPAEHSRSDFVRRCSPWSVSRTSFFALGPALDFLLVGKAVSRHPRLTITAALAGVTGALLGYLPQLLAYNALNGYPGPAEHVQRKMFWYAPHGLQVLASPHHGLFFWTPLAILALIGLFFVRERIVAVSLAIMVASQVYVAGSVESWTVAGAFGQRRFVNLTIILVIGLAALWTAAARKGRPATRSRGFVVADQQARRRSRCRDRRVHLVEPCVDGAVCNPADGSPAARAWPQRLSRVRDAATAGPSLAYRYLTDRGSFYESQPKQH